MERITRYYEHYCPAAGKNVTVCEDLVSGEKHCTNQEDCPHRPDCKSRFVCGGK